MWVVEWVCSWAVCNMRDRVLLLMSAVNVSGLLGARAGWEGSASALDRRMIQK